MSNVLYRKYRSRSFSEIIGQENVISILRESIIKDNISHAYLFCGPRGTGKTSVARILSRAVNCANFEENKDVCNSCENCISIINEQAMDITEMDAASNRGIEEIRNLKDSVNYLPTVLKRKVYIIDEAHMLTKEAFNALLKTLEEPPEHVIFILATTEAHKLPITILSRVERYDFRLATKEEMVKKLSFILENENRKADGDIWDVIYTKSGGSFRDAESLLGKIISNTDKKKLNKEYIFNVLGIYSEDDIGRLIETLINKDFKTFKKSLDSLDNLNGNINTLIDQVLESLHKILTDNVLEGQGTSSLIEIINLFIKTKKDIRDFADKRLILELNVINFLNNSKKVTKSITVLPELEEAEVEEKNVQKFESKIQNFLGVNQLSQIANHPEVRLPRLKAVLMNSEYELKDNNLRIYNKYKFNINFLQKPEIKNVILSVVSSLNSQITEVVFELRDGAKEETNINAEIHNSKVNIPEEPNEQHIDNSDIIEKIL